MLFYFDIETAPNDSPEIVAELTAAIRPPGNMKKAETIAAWEKDERPLIVQERLKATALDGTYGQIFAAGWAVDDDEPRAYIGPEHEVLAALFAAIVEAVGTRGENSRLDNDLVFVGHNVLDFDLRFTWQRAVINGIRPPGTFTAAVHAKPWAARIADTMLLWNPSRERRISLANLCRALGVRNPKTDLDGATVYDAYKRGEVDRVREYVGGDVMCTRDCYLRMVYGRVAA